jgi:hypothetical protein
VKIKPRGALLAHGINGLTESREAPLGLDPIESRVAKLRPGRSELGGARPNRALYDFVKAWA